MKLKKELTLVDFYEMEQLEKQYYDTDFITPAMESYECYKQRKGSILVVEDKGKIVGFMNLFPIEYSLYEQIKRGVFNDKDLTYKDIVEIETGEGDIYLFLSCIVVDKAYRKKGVSALLLQAYCRYYEQKQVKSIIIDNVTEDGDDFSQKLGFQFITVSDHDSNIYEISFAHFFERIFAIYPSYNENVRIE
ncbi:MAG: GNAT family N-acetyltransferase [Bacillaceae bacterium]